MTISFDTIPMFLTPGSHVEFDTSRSGKSRTSVKVVIFGQRLAAGTAPALTLKRVTNPAEARSFFGQGSMLAHMLSAWLHVDRTAELWAIALDDLQAGTAATKTITLTGAPTADGTLPLLIAGQSVQVGVTQGQSLASIATAIVAAVTDNPDLPYTATSAAGVVTLTSKHKGLVANTLDVRAGYYVDDAIPAGLQVAIAAGAAGAGDPDVSTVFAALGDTQFTAFVHPYTSAAALTAIETELASRADAMRQIEGMAYTATSGTLSALETLGESRNSAFSVIGGIKGLPSPSYELAAVMAARIVPSGAIDPARPFTYLTLPGIMPPAITDRFTREEREFLLADGISTFVVDAGGTVCIEQPITTYRRNALGIADDSQRSLNAMLCLFYVRQDVRAMVSLKYPRHKLGNDGGNYGIGQKIITPSTMKAELVVLARAWEEKAIVENIDQYIAELIVERNPNDDNRLDALLPPDFVNQFLRFAAVIQPVG